MNRQLKVRGIRRKQIDNDKLAMAFLLLAKEARTAAQDERQITDGADQKERA